MGGKNSGSYLLGTGVLFSLLVACGVGKKFDNSVFFREYSGSFIVSTVATDPSTGPGLLSLFDSAGNLVSVLRDFYSSSEFPTGLAFVGPESIVTAVDGSDRLDQMNLRTGEINPFTVSSAITAAPLRQIARSDADGSIYIIESSTASIEKVDSDGSRVGNPFIPTTVGSCTLATPYGIAYIPTSENIAVISSAASGRLQIYNKNGGCVNQVTTAPFNSGTPTGIAYHAATNKLIVTFSTNHAIYSVNVDGTGAQQIFLNSAVINTPKSVTTDSRGFIYVGSNGTDTIEKLQISGGTATRVTSGSLAGPSIYTQNSTAILVLP